MRLDHNMIDIHAEVVPGLDDRPRTLEESLRMCELYLRQGVTAVVATPHSGSPDSSHRAGSSRDGLRTRDLQALVEAAADRQHIHHKLLEWGPGEDFLGEELEQVRLLGRRQRAEEYLAEVGTSASLTP